MRIIVATISMIIISLFGDYTSTMPKHDISASMPPISREIPQPKPYLHDKDTTLMIQPILENADLPGYRYIQDIKFYYKDLYYCSDMNKITFVTDDTSFSIVSIKRMSCKILAIVRLNKTQQDNLGKFPIRKVIIENLVTDNVYTYEILNTKYFIDAYKVTDSKY